MPTPDRTTRMVVAVRPPPPATDDPPAADDLSVEDELSLNRVCDTFEAWRAGERPSVEQEANALW